MYRPYVGGKTVNRKHLSTILDIDIEYPRRGLSVGWWIAGIAALGLAATLWFSRNPLPL
jgi:hypothetical protein